MIFARRVTTNALAPEDVAETAQEAPALASYALRAHCALAASQHVAGPVSFIELMVALGLRATAASAAPVKCESVHVALLPQGAEGQGEVTRVGQFDAHGNGLLSNGC